MCIRDRADVLRHRHVREQRVTLKRGTDRVAEGREVLHRLAVKARRAARNRRSAAAAWSCRSPRGPGGELVVADVQGDLVQGPVAAAGSAVLHAQGFDRDRAAHPQIAPNQLFLLALKRQLDAKDNLRSILGSAALAAER